MAEKITLDLDKLEVVSFATYSQNHVTQFPVDSAPAMCTCIDICQPSEDLYCSGGC